jgi:prophage tail gpP-like protein
MLGGPVNFNGLRPMSKSFFPPRALLAGALGGALVLAACSSQQTYGLGQGWQRTECNKMPDADQRQRCMASAAMSFDEFQRQVQATQGAKQPRAPGG